MIFKVLYLKTKFSINLKLICNYINKKNNFD